MANYQVKEIHRMFDFDLLKGLQEANDQGFLESVKPADLPAQQFIPMVERYRNKYPFYNFITERQLCDICFKYGLRAAPYWMYSGKIPDENMRQIKAFKLFSEDDNCELRPIFRERELPKDLPGNSFRVKSGWLPLSEAGKPGAVYSFKGKLALVTNESKCSLFAFLTGKGGIRIAAQMFAAHPALPPLECNGDETRALLTLSKEKFSRRLSVQYSRNICPLVVAPLSDFRQGLTVSGAHLVPKDEGGFRILQSPYPGKFDGYMAEMKQLREIETGRQKAGAIQVSEQSLGRVSANLQYLENEKRKAQEQEEREAYLRQLQIDDPIVLQPVDGGYFVVTKWGAEAGIAEIYNPIAN